MAHIWDFVEVYKDDLYANRSPLANAMAISATSENPERTLMFLNQLETDQKLYDMVQYGIEGETYVLTENAQNIQREWMEPILIIWVGEASGLYGSHSI